MSEDAATRFPGESDEYRRARDQLLEDEIKLRRAIERVAARFNIRLDLMRKLENPE